MIRAKSRRKPGVMNPTESRYAVLLAGRRHAGDIAAFRYEPVKLRLADNTFYTPDFMVLLLNGEVEFHEVKGSWKAPHQDDARVKIKVAAEMFPEFRFLSAEVVSKKNGGGWKFAYF